MGNETSTCKANPNLSKDDVAILRKNFPPSPVKRLFASWDVFESDSREVVVNQLVDAGGNISWDKYQNLAGSVLYGTTEERIRFLLQLGNCGIINTNLTGLQTALRQLFKAFTNLLNLTVKTNDSLSATQDSWKLARSVTYEIEFPGEKRKNWRSVMRGEGSASGERDEHVDYDQVEKMFLTYPYIESIILKVMSHCFQLSLRNVRLPVSLPSLPQSEQQFSLLSPLQVIFLSHALPHSLQGVWRPLYNTAVHGESFSKLVGGIRNRGPSVILVKDEENNIFGGFATDSWTPGPKFYGNSSSFLFQLEPVLQVYETTPFNQNYQYFNLKQKTMPNGLGMGGQLEYWGFWIDSEFGVVRTSPSCTTYHSPQLGTLEGKIVDLEVWGVGPEPEEEDGGGGNSVLDMDPEAQAVMEMMGKTFHSKVIREVDKEESSEQERIMQ